MIREVPDLLPILFRSVSELLGNPDSSTFRPETMLDSIVGEVGFIDFAGMAAPVGTRFRILEFSGPNREEWIDAAFELGEGYLGQVGLLEQPLNWKGMQYDPRTAFFRERGLRPAHLFGCPIVSDSELLGVLFAGSCTEIGGESDDIARYLQILSNAIGRMLLLERLKTKERHHEAQLADLVEISRIMNMADDVKKALYVFIDISFILLGPAIYSHLLIQLPGSAKAQIVSRGMKQEQVQGYSRRVAETYFSPGKEPPREEFALNALEEGGCMLVCPIVVRSALYGVLSVKLPNAEIYEGVKDIFSTFVFLFGITVERIASAKEKEGIRGKARTLHEATKMWNPAAYERAERAKALSMEFAAEAKLSAAEKEELEAATVLCVYPNDGLQEQLAGAPLLAALKECAAVLGGAPDAAETRGTTPRSRIGQLLAMTYAYLERGEQTAPILDLDVEEPLRGEFIAFLTRRLTVEFEMSMEPEEASPAPPVFDDWKKKVKISLREQDVLELILKGLSNREIGEALFISEHTVKNHITNIFQKLEVSDRAHAIAKIYQIGMQR